MPGAHQSSVVRLVSVRDDNVPSVRYQVSDLGNSELLGWASQTNKQKIKQTNKQNYLYLGGEGEVVAQVRHVVLEQEVEPLVELVVLGLHVLVLDRLGQDVLVETPSEVTLQQLVVVDRLGDHSPHELEVAEVVGVYVAEK